MCGARAAWLQNGGMEHGRVHTGAGVVRSSPHGTSTYSAPHVQLTRCVRGHFPHGPGWHVSGHGWFPQLSRPPHGCVHGGQFPGQHRTPHLCFPQFRLRWHRFSHRNGSQHFTSFVERLHRHFFFYKIITI